MMENYNDQELIYDYLKKGDEKSLEILIQRHLKPVYGFAYRYVGNAQEAEDITQDVFVKVWKNLKKFDGQKSFKAWIFTIAQNTSLDFLKKKKAMQFSDLENESGENALVEKFIDSSPLPDEFLEQKGIREIFIKAAGKLFPKYRRVLFLRHEENLTFREIAETLGEPLNTVKSRHRRALIALKKLLS
ncbi:MAG: sigma-70 family RNA polymerase sigma factor [Candidatus Tagabacteria bacterium]